MTPLCSTSCVPLAGVELRELDRAVFLTDVKTQAAVLHELSVLIERLEGLAPRRDS